MAHPLAYDNSKRSNTLLWVPENPKLTERGMEREQMVRKIRTLERYEPHIEAAIYGPSTFVVGEGIFPYPKTGTPEYKEQFLQKFANWASNQLVCDKGGKFDYVSMQYLMDGYRRGYGEGFLFLQKSRSGYPQFQITDPLLIKSGAKNTDGVRDGIRINKNEKPLGCYVTDQKLGKSSYRTSLKYYRRNLYTHLVELKGAHQLRGRTPLHGSANLVHDILDILTTTKDSMQTHLGLAVHIQKNKNSTYSVESSYDDVDEQNELERTGEEPKKESGISQIQGATLIEEPDIEKVNMLSSPRQVTPVSDMVEILLRQIAMSTGYTYEFLYDMSKLGGVTARIDLEANYRTIEKEQNRLIRQVLKPLVRFWTARMIKEGHLEGAPDDWWKIGFRTPAKATADIKHNGKNTRENLNYGLTTERDALADAGTNFEDHVKRSAEDVAYTKDVCEKAGITLSEYYRNFQEQSQKDELSTHNK